MHLCSSFHRGKVSIPATLPGGRGLAQQWWLRGAVYLGTRPAG